MTVGEAITELQSNRDVEMVFYLYVVDERRHLVGVVSLRRLLLVSPETPLKRIMTADLMSARVRHEGLFFQRDSATGRYEDLIFGKGWQGPSQEYRKIEKLEIDPVFRAFIANPLHERIARALIDGPIALYRAVLFTKSARGGTALPWHQDGGIFWGISPAPFLQIWTAIDDCPAGAAELLKANSRSP